MLHSHNLVPTGSVFFIPSLFFLCVRRNCTMVKWEVNLVCGQNSPYNSTSSSFSLVIYVPRQVELLVISCPVYLFAGDLNLFLTGSSPLFSYYCLNS